jgi:hypothetical protein
MKLRSTSVAWWTDNNVHIWGTEQPYAQIEHQHDSPKVNVFCAVSCEKVHGPFFFTEATMTGDLFLDMLKTGCYPNWITMIMITFYNWMQLPPPPIFTWMYECLSIMFFHSAESDVLRMETTTFSLGHPIHLIVHHAVSFFGGSLKTAFMCYHCPWPSRNFMTGKHMHCRPLQQTCYTESGMSLITVQMCVML